jgi:hypothetical protein
MLIFPMSDAQFAAAVTRLREDGVYISGPSGTLTKDGVTANYTHADDKLTVEITDHPFFFPLSLIEGKLKEYFDKIVSSA